MAKIVSEFASQHPAVAKVLPDPTSTNAYITVVGYVGAASDAARVRVYLSLAFDGYLEFDVTAIKHRVDPHSAPTAPSTIWLSADTVLTSTSRTATEKARGAKWIAGNIAEQNLGALTKFHGYVARTESDRCPTNDPAHCWSDSPKSCPSIGLPCPTDGVDCATDENCGGN